MRNREDIDALKDDMKAYRTRVATIAQAGAAFGTIVAAVAWLVDHASLFATATVAAH